MEQLECWRVAGESGGGGRRVIEEEGEEEEEEEEEDYWDTGILGDEMWRVQKTKGVDECRAAAAGSGCGGAGDGIGWDGGLALMGEVWRYEQVWIEGEVPSRYSLYHYVFLDPDEKKLSREGAVVMLFVHGHGGGYRQFVHIAEATHSSHGRNKSLEFFAVDFDEELSAFSGKVLKSQGVFIKRSLEGIKRHLSNRNISILRVILVGHSMGGVAARAALLEDGFDASLVQHLVTLASPHVNPVLSNDATFELFYEQLNTEWKNQYMALFNHMSFLSFTGGSLDVQIEPWSTNISSLVPATHGLTIFTTSIPQYWSPLGHNEIISCSKFIEIFTKQFDIFMGPSVMHPEERIEIFQTLFSPTFSIIPSTTLSKFECTETTYNSSTLHDLQIIPDDGYYYKEIDSSLNKDLTYLVFDLSSAESVYSLASFVFSPKNGEDISKRIELFGAKGQESIFCSFSKSLFVFPGVRREGRSKDNYIANIPIEYISFNYVVLEIDCKAVDSCGGMYVHLQLWSPDIPGVSQFEIAHFPSVLKTMELLIPSKTHTLLCQVSFNSSKYPEYVNVALNNNEASDGKEGLMGIYYGDSEDYPGRFELYDDHGLYKQIHVAEDENHTDTFFVLSNPASDIRISVRLNYFEIGIQVLRVHHSLVFVNIFFVVSLIFFKVSFDLCDGNGSSYDIARIMDPIALFLDVIMSGLIGLRLYSVGQMSWLLLGMIWLMSFALAIVIILFLCLVCRSGGLVLFCVTQTEITEWLSRSAHSALSIQRRNTQGSLLLCLRVSAYLFFPYGSVLALAIALMLVNMLNFALFMRDGVGEISILNQKEARKGCILEVFNCLLVYFVIINFQKLIFSFRIGEVLNEPSQLVWDWICALPLILFTHMLLNMESTLFSCMCKDKVLRGDSRVDDAKTLLLPATKEVNYTIVPLGCEFFQLAWSKLIDALVIDAKEHLPVVIGLPITCTLPVLETTANGNVSIANQVDEPDSK
eukprot:Nk52_evm80s62 gene=Nk52_evmTU80s62